MKPIEYTCDMCFSRKEEFINELGISNKIWTYCLECCENRFHSKVQFSKNYADDTGEFSPSEH